MPRRGRKEKKEGWLEKKIRQLRERQEKLAKEQKRNDAEKELEGLVVIDVVKLPLKKRIKNAFDQWMDDYLYRRYGIKWKKITRGEYLVGKYTDVQGDVANAFRKLRVQPEEQLDWLEFWFDLDENGDNQMEYQEFLDTFSLEPTLYVRRFFDLLNVSLSGYVPFKEFILQAWDMLVLDKEACLRTCFRLLSRQGKKFDPKKSSIDKEDLYIFLEDRYRDMAESALTKRSTILYNLGDDDCSGGIDIDEFSDLVMEHPVLLYPGYAIMRAMRYRLFGDSYWKEIVTSRPKIYPNGYDDEFFTMMDGVHRTQMKTFEIKFRKDFPIVHKIIKEQREQKKKEEEELRELTWQLAMKTRDRTTFLLEVLDEPRDGVWHFFRRWKDIVRWYKCKEEEEADMKKKKGLFAAFSRAKDASEGKKTDNDEDGEKKKGGLLGGLFGPSKAKREANEEKLKKEKAEEAKRLKAELEESLRLQPEEVDDSESQDGHEKKFGKYKSLLASTGEDPRAIYAKILQREVKSFPSAVEIVSRYKNTYRQTLENNGKTRPLPTMESLSKDLMLSKTRFGKLQQNKFIPTSNGNNNRVAPTVG